MKASTIYFKRVTKDASRSVRRQALWQQYYYLKLIDGIDRNKKEVQVVNVRFPQPIWPRGFKVLCEHRLLMDFGLQFGRLASVITIFSAMTFWAGGLGFVTTPVAVVVSMLGTANLSYLVARGLMVGIEGVGRGLLVGIGRAYGGDKVVNRVLGGYLDDLQVRLDTIGSGGSGIARQGAIWRCRRLMCEALLRHCLSSGWRGVFGTARG
jgi:hypothetical protein